MRINRRLPMLAGIAVVCALAFPALAAEDSRTVPAFSAVKLGGAAEMDVTVGDKQSVRLEGDADVLRRVTTEVHGDTLEIRQHGGDHWWSPFRWHDHERLVVHIVTPHLNALSIAGAAQVSTSGLNGGDMAFTISGAGQLRAQGHVEKLALEVNGAGDAQLGDLIEDRATVSVHGAGNVVVQPKQSLHAEISGVGAVHYIGDPPDVTKDIRGVGSIERK